MNNIINIVIRLLKKSPTFVRVLRIVDFSHKIGLKVRYFLIPVVLSLSAALFDGLSVGLLIPLVDGLIQGTFESAYHSPVLKNVLLACPASITSSNQNTFLFIVFLTFTAAVLNHAIRYLSILSMSHLVRKSANNLRKRIFNKYLAQGKLFFDTNTYGHLSGILQGFTLRIAAQMSNLNLNISKLMITLVFVVMMFAISWPITLGVILVVPLINKVFTKLINRIKHTSEVYSDKIKGLHQKSFDILSCMPLILVNSAQEKEIKEYAAISDTTEIVERSLDKKYGIIDPLQRIFMLVLIVLAVMFLSSYTQARGTVQIARMMVYFYLLREVAANIGAVNVIKAILGLITGQVKGIRQVLEMTDKYEIRNGTRQFEGLQDKIEIKDLTFQYEGEKQVLKGLSVDFSKNATTALVGATGSGKTTIISLIMRLYECPANTIFIDNRDIRDYKISTLMSKIALVSQDTQLFNASLKNNITYGQNNVSDAQLMAVVEQARLGDFVKSLSLGVDTLIGDRGVRVSGGEKQRIAIARALLKDAEILILDEATSAMDSKTEKAIHEAVANAIGGKTAIIIAHRLSTIQKADKICVIDDGRLVEEGVLAELLSKKGKFYEYWEEQKFF